LNAAAQAGGQAAIVVNRNGQNVTVNHAFQRADDALDRGTNRADATLNPNR
jgi:hypothetical protein